jgi:hypothetical protein
MEDGLIVMARLIPSFTDDHTPPGERDVFNMLAGGPEDWVVIHSLDLAPWNRGLRTEIDFLVIVPDVGVMCVEVKSHENLSFDGERWYPATISRSPFKQASDGRYTFHRRLISIAPELGRIPVVHCCIFPRSPFALNQNLSVQPWELMDARLFRGFKTAADFCSELKLRMKQGIAVDAGIIPLSSPLSLDRVEHLIRCCVPVQRRHPGAREEIQRRHEHMAALLREQQKPVLQIAELNERLVVSGGAGTGKTLIAMELARRLADQRQRVALLCFNQLVGSWMRKQMEDPSLPRPNLVVGRAIQVMAEMAEIEIPKETSKNFWEVVLPQKLKERLTDPDFRVKAAFDYIVVDEAQDLLARPAIWGCLSQFLVGGFEQGRYAVFGDFDNQVLADREVMTGNLRTLIGTAGPVRWRLSENCRNYRIVGETAVCLSGIATPIYSGYLRSGGSFSNYDIAFYSHEQEQGEQIIRWLKYFEAQGYQPSEITLLSFRTDESSAAQKLRNQGLKLRPAWSAGNQIGYASVHAFKGMENKAIILTDVFLGDHAFDRHLFYTGMTRATESVRVLCDKECQATLKDWLTAKAI